MAAQPSGEITEYTEFSNIKTRSARPTASAPPEPPSPMTAVMIGVGNEAISIRLLAIASACPRSSAPRPGYAPGVSTSVITGAPNFAAMRMRRIAFRYPSGCAIPKLRRSEEHTSELQSLRHLVCRLLLEKKKKENKNERTY